MQSGTQTIQARFAELVEKGADAGSIVDVAISTWRGINGVLSPIIGQQGVAALYKRSVYLECTTYPCLTAVLESHLPHGDFIALRTTLAQQTRSNAVATNSALLQTFYDLLSNLIGVLLTERLLQPVWENPLSGDAVQDTLS